MAKFMLIIHQTPDMWKQLSPEELQRKVENYQSWVAKFRSSGRYVSGEKLGENGGKVVSLQNGRANVMDGPYVETKEHLGGILALEARDMNHAVQLMSQHPALTYGNSFEIRPAADISEIEKASEQRRQSAEQTKA